MDKTYFEKMILEKAKHRLKNEWKNLRTLIGKDKIGEKLEMNGRPLVTSYGYGKVSSAVFSEEHEAQGTNLKEALSKRLEEIIKEETDNVISKIESLEYLLYVKNDGHHGGE